MFGHQYPVYSVAELFTETRELRNVGREVPRAMQFRVLRRDNSVCQICKKNVGDYEINFDHIIPWSKGGSSDESNIRILCESCNRKRQADFEGEYLIAHIRENDYDPQKNSTEMILDLIRLYTVLQIIEEDFGQVSQSEFCTAIKQDAETDAFMYDLVSNLHEVLQSDLILFFNKEEASLLSNGEPLYCCELS